MFRGAADDFAVVQLADGQRQPRDGDPRAGVGRHAVVLLRVAVPAGRKEGIKVVVSSNIAQFINLISIIAVQCNPLNGSPYNGSIRLLVQFLASPISMLTY